VLGLQTIPEIKQDDNLAAIVVEAVNTEAGGVQDGDILVLTSKIVSKAAGRTRRLSDVVPGKRALAISRRTGKDAKWLQMIFDEGHDILAIIPLKGALSRHIVGASQDARCSEQLVEHERAICITGGRDGRVHTCDAGIDGSNHPAGVVSLLPEDPDKTAKEIREQIRSLCGKQVAVILADTEMIPFGTMDFAIGSSGIEPISKMFGDKDLFGKPKFGGIDLVANELTAASTLVFGQTGAGIPVAVIRGYEYETSETENISGTTVLLKGNGGLAAVVRAVMRATACAKGLKRQLLLKVASWFV